MEEKSEIKKRRDPLQVIDRESGRIYYGGDQGWYKSNTMAFAGCGSVACVNMLRELANRQPQAFKGKGMSDELKILTEDTMYKDDFTDLMSSVYKAMFVMEIPLVRRLCDLLKRGNKLFKIIPPSFGLSLFGFITGTLNYCRKRGLLLHAKTLPTAFTSYDRGLDFIRKGLKESGSVVMLTSRNRHPLKLYSGKSGELSGGFDSKNGVKSHFMTITDIVDPENGKGPLIKISTWGRVATVSYYTLNKSWQKMSAYTSCLYYFAPTGSEKVVLSDMAKSYAIFVWAMFKGTFGWLIPGR